MNKKIDNGKIRYKKFYKKPKKSINIEKNFDNKIRAITLVSYLKSKSNHKFRKPTKTYMPYYIAHPIIRMIVIDKKNLLEKF